MASSSQTPQLPNWITRNAVTIILLVVTGTVSFVMGQARGDAVQDEKIQALSEQVEKKVSREEFAQFTKSVEVQLQMINENLMALRREAKQGR